MDASALPKQPPGTPSKAPVAEKSTKTIGFSMVLVNFHEIDVFKKSTKRYGELDFCGLKNASKSDEN